MSLLRIFTLVATAAFTTSVFVVPIHSASAQVKKAQELLLKLGYEVGEPDGAWGGKTRAALNAFQKDQGFNATRRLSKGAVVALEMVAAGAKKFVKSPWSIKERIGNTLMLDNGARVYYSERGAKIVRTNSGKTIKKTWIKKADGTYCEYLFATKKMACENEKPLAYVMYPDVKNEGAVVAFDKKSGARRFSIRLVEGNKLKR